MLNRCDAHESSCPALGDRNGSPKSCLSHSALVSAKPGTKVTRRPWKPAFLRWDRSVLGSWCRIGGAYSRVTIRDPVQYICMTIGAARNPIENISCHNENSFLESNPDFLEELVGNSEIAPLTLSRGGQLKTNSASERLGIQWRLKPHGQKPC